MKKSLEKSQNVLEQKRKNDQAKILHKQNFTLTIIASNFVREQLIAKILIPYSGCLAVDVGHLFFLEEPCKIKL